MTHHSVLETNSFPCGYPLMPLRQPVSGAGNYPVFFVHAVALHDDVVDGHGGAPIGDAELDESTAGVVGTRFLDQDVTHMAVIPITGSYQALNGMLPITHNVNP